MRVTSVRKRRYIPQFESLEQRLTPGRISNMPAPAAFGPGLMNGGSHNIVAGDTPSPNNDNVSDKINFLSQDLVFGQTGYIEVEYHVANSDGITEYWFEDRTTNSTGQNWTSYMFQIGFGTGTNFAEATVLAGEGLDFDWPSQDLTPRNEGPTVFNSLSHEHSFIQWSGAPGHNNGVTTTHFFSVDLPDYDGAQMPESAIWRNAQGQIIGYKMTIRRTPLTGPSGPSGFGFDPVPGLPNWPDSDGEPQPALPSPVPDSLLFLPFVLTEEDEESLDLAGLASVAPPRTVDIVFAGLLETVAEDTLQPVV
jgi:hypothetical protein